MMKNYLLEVLQRCSEEKFGQDAIEWAILSGVVRLSYDLESDTRGIMSRYDQIIEGYRRSLPETHHEERKARAPMKRALRRGPDRSNSTSIRQSRKA